jgi:acyl-CoA thioester hydrolase
LAAFEWPVRVYYEDTDAGGVVYHTSYIRFFERARTEWLRARGFTQSRLRDVEGVIFSVVNLTTDYLSPARLDDLLTVRLTAHLNGGASVNFEQEILRGSDAATLARGLVKVACLDARTFKPKRLPKGIYKELA